MDSLRRKISLSFRDSEEYYGYARPVIDIIGLRANSPIGACVVGSIQEFCQIYGEDPPEELVRYFMQRGEPLMVRRLLDPWEWFEEQAHVLRGASFSKTWTDDPLLELA